MFADLHLHTCFSDGTYTPRQLAAEARRHDLAALALTDHDTVEGCTPMARACAEQNIEFVPGTELTAEVEGTEMHLPGYLLDVEHPELLLEMKRFQAVRQERIREMVARLNELNIPIEAEAVFSLANCQSPGRPHVARALVQAGHCATLDEAFERFLKKHRPAWVPKFKVSARAAIALVHRAGGVAVLAHPGLHRQDDFIPALVEEGLDGLECFHSKHSPSAAARYVDMAQRYNLLITGGSDCHGMNKGEPLIGTVRIPYRFVEILKERASPAGGLKGPRKAASMGRSSPD
jgi:predicted metal-dependent phosphoesterase TrpH